MRVRVELQAGRQAHAGPGMCHISKAGESTPGRCGRVGVAEDGQAHSIAMRCEVHAFTHRAQRVWKQCTGDCNQRNMCTTAARPGVCFRRRP